jgi:hypothetical protein
MGFDASALRGGLAAWREASGWKPALAAITAAKEPGNPAAHT